MPYASKLRRNRTVRKVVSLCRVHCGAQGFDAIGEVFEFFSPGATGPDVPRLHLTKVCMDGFEGVAEVFRGRRLLTMGHATVHPCFQIAFAGENHVAWRSWWTMNRKIQRLFPALYGPNTFTEKLCDFFPGT